MLAAVDQLRAARDDLAGWLADQGLEVADSDANFVLFGRFADRHAVWQALLDRGVLIRETRSGRLAAGLGRHPGRDGGVQGRADRGAGSDARRTR